MFEGLVLKFALLRKFHFEVKC